MIRLAIVISPLCIALSGCASVEFGAADRADGFVYYEPVPFLIKKVAADCAVSVEVTTLPGLRRTVIAKGGLGTSKLTFKTTNGMITDFTAERDTKMPETIDSVAGLAKTVGAFGFAETKSVTPWCEPTWTLHAIKVVAGGLEIDPQAVTRVAGKPTSLIKAAAAMVKESAPTKQDVASEPATTAGSNEMDKPQP